MKRLIVHVMKTPCLTYCPFVHAVPAFPTTTFPDGIHSLYYNHTEADDYSNARFDPATIDDDGKEEGYYSAAYLDNHTQHGVYKTKDIYGHIVEVTDEKTVVYRDYYIITCANMKTLDSDRIQQQ